MATIRKVLYALGALLVASALLGGCGASMPAHSDDILAQMSRDSAGK